jgi:signal transduction histidine kinase
VAESIEKETQELTRVQDQMNRVVMRGVEQVSAANNPRAVLLGFLLEAKKSVGAFCAAAYRSLEGSRLSPLVVIIDDHLVSPEEISASPSFRRVEEWTASDPGGLFTRLAAGAPQYIKVSECEPCLYPELAHYHRSVGNVAAWYLPLMLGNQYQGCVSLGIQRDSEPSYFEEKVLSGFSHHLSLALELTRLADRESEAIALAERQRLAREVHDTLAQGFLGIIFQLDAARQELISDPNSASKAITKAYELAKQNLAEARRSVETLRASTQTQDDIIVRLSNLLQDLAKVDERVRFETSLTTHHAPSDVSNEIVKITSEAVQNAIKHGSPSQIEVSVSCDERTMHVTIADNGIGFDASKVQEAGRFGIVGMKERATSVNCEFLIDSQPRKGTLVTITWPFSS